MHSIKVKKINGLIAKTLGLTTYKSACSLFFKTRFGLHTIGMSFQIDVLILDNKNRVVKMAENLKPLRIFLWSPKYDSVIELPSGYIKTHNIKVGEQIRLIFE